MISVLHIGLPLMVGCWCNISKAGAFSRCVRRDQPGKAGHVRRTSISNPQL
jgi:hypothetical protein